MLEIACSSDARYLPHCAVMIRSLMAEHPDRDLRVHVLVPSDVPASDIERLTAMAAGTMAAIVVHRVPDEALDGLPSWGRIPVTMWARILLPDLLADVERVLYVDVDVLIVGALDGLWSLDLSEAYLAGVTNVPERHRFDHALDLGLANPQSYFNSGVLLFNLERMRRFAATDAIREYVAVHASDLLWPDQDALNVVLGDGRVPLHPRYNLMNSIRNFSWSDEFLSAVEVTEAIADPAIIHFEGPDDNKPWHLLCEHPAAITYRRYRRETPWPRLRPSGLTPGNVLRLAARRRRGAGLRP